MIVAMGPVSSLRAALLPSAERCLHTAGGLRPHHKTRPLKDTCSAPIGWPERQYTLGIKIKGLIHLKKEK